MIESEFYKVDIIKTVLINNNIYRKEKDMENVLFYDENFSLLGHDTLYDIAGGIDWVKVGVVAVFAIGACAIAASGGVAAVGIIATKAGITSGVGIAKVVVGVCAGVSGLAVGIGTGDIVYNHYMG